MKNIHILPTDKPSRLVLDDTTQQLILINKGEALWGNRNIYITSDEEVKDGEYGICLNLVRKGFKSHQAVFKMDAEQRQAMNELGGQKKAEVLKVILTTDQDLIKDGVQPIDDEFLEWFVKNPSCEEVEIELFPKFSNKLYGIIIPKEEPKQETLEEAAEKYIAKDNNNRYYNDFIAGAKWQSERMYSEEDMIEFGFSTYCYISELMGVPFNLMSENRLNAEEWFEQFKKK